MIAFLQWFVILCGVASAVCFGVAAYYFYKASK